MNLSLPRVLVFSLAGLPVTALSVAILVYLPPYFASHLGVSLSVISLAWFTVRMLDIVVDPLLGLAMDRTVTPFGRYRAWLVGGVPLFMFSTWMLFAAPVGMSAFYLVSWLLILYFANSILTLAHSAWTGTLVTEYDQRSRVFGILAMTGVISIIVLLLVPIVTKNMGASDAAGILAMGWFVILLTPVTVGLTAYFTPETITPNVKSERPPWRDYSELLTRPELIRLVLAQICLTLGPGWMSALYLFFFHAYLGFSQDQSTILLIAYVVAGVIGAPATARIAMQLGKDRTLMVTTTSYSLGLAAILLLPHASMGWTTLIMLWCGAMAAGFDLVVRAMLADVSDEIRLEQGKERISLLYALTSLAAKVAAAIAIIVTYPVLTAVGFDPKEGAVNSASAIRGLEIAYLAGPIIFVMLGGACVVGWKLTAARHAQIRAALDERDAAVLAETTLIESVTVTTAVVMAAGAEEQELPNLAGE